MRNGKILCASAGFILMVLCCAPAFAENHSKTIETEIIFDGQKYVNTTQFTWEEDEYSVPEGGIEWDGTDSYLSLPQYGAADLIAAPESDPYAEAYVKNQILFMGVLGKNFHKIQQIVAKHGCRVVGYLSPTEDYVIESIEDKDYNQLQNLMNELKEEDLILAETVMLRYVYPICENTNPPSDPWRRDDETNEDYVPNWEKILSWEAAEDNQEKPKDRTWGVKAINAIEAWKYIDYMKEINVGLIDGTRFLDHPDLQYEARYEWTSKLDHQFGNPNDAGDSHAMHVAGTFAAKFDNGKGISGVFPKGRIVGISELKSWWNYLNYGIFYTDAASEKEFISKMIENDVHVINMSMGKSYRNNSGELTSEGKAIKNYNTEEIEKELTKNRDTWTNKYGLGEFFNRIKDQGYDFVFVQSAGNDGFDTEFNWWPVWIDNDYFQDRLIVVGAVRRQNSGKIVFCDSYNYGKRIDVVAPGETIYSTVIDELGNPSYSNEFSGTSMAAPHVAGTAAMIWSLAPMEMTGPQVKQFITETAKEKLHHDANNVDSDDYDYYVKHASPQNFNEEERARNYKLLDAGAAVRAAYESIYGTADSPEPITNGKLMGYVTANSVGVADTEIEIKTALTTVVTLITDANGGFLTELAPGEYTLHVSKQGYEETEIAFTISANQTTEINVELIEKRSKLNVQVTSDGIPVSGAKVSLNQGQTLVTSAVSDETGIAVLTTEALNYRIVVEKDGYASYSNTVFIAAESENDLSVELVPESEVYTVSENSGGSGYIDWWEWGIILGPVGKPRGVKLYDSDGTLLIDSATDLDTRPIRDILDKGGVRASRISTGGYYAFAIQMRSQTVMTFVITATAEDGGEIRSEFKVKIENGSRIYDPPTVPRI